VAPILLIFLRINWPQLELTSIQANYWRGQMHCGSSSQNWPTLQRPRAMQDIQRRGSATGKADYLYHHQLRAKRRHATTVSPAQWTSFSQSVNHLTLIVSINQLNDVNPAALYAIPIPSSSLTTLTTIINLA